MSAYRMMEKDGSCTFHKIMHDRKWVGRVYQMADGEWQAAINKEVKGRGKTPKDAFEMAVSRHLGYSNASELREHNSMVRAAKKIRRQRADELFNRYINAPMKDQMKILDSFTSGELIEFMSAFTRSLKS